MICAAPVAKGPGELPEQWGGPRVFHTLQACADRIRVSYSRRIYDSGDRRRSRSQAWFSGAAPALRRELQERAGRTYADQVFAGFWGTVEFAYDGNGNVLPGWPHVADNYISSPPALVDIDGDGIDEIFIGEEDSRIHAYRADGSVLPGWPSPFSSVGGQSIFTPAIADLDGDVVPEIIVQGEGMIEVWKGDGTPFPGWPRGTGGSSGNSAPVVGDVDGGGQPDIVVMASFGSNGLDSKG